MKLLFHAAALFVLVSFSTCDLTPEQEDQVFGSYLKEFNIRLGRADNIEEVKRVFCDRFNGVERHNEKFRDGKVSYELGIDEYSHLTHEEFIHKRTGYTPHVGNSSDELSAEDAKGGKGGRASPSSHSWLNTNGVVRPVQSQGGCGSCWAFAAIGAIEGQMALKKKRFEKLSEQEVIECAKDGSRLLGCNGGWDGAVYAHAYTKKGITTLNNKPYRGNTNSGCNTNTPRAPNSATQKGFYRVNKNNEQSMKETLFSAGPLYVSFHVSDDFQSYRSGIYTDSRGLCRSQSNNHAVLLVGYGNQNGLDYWLLKNSWGTGWGDKGFFKIQRGKNLCGIAEDVSYPALA